MLGDAKDLLEKLNSPSDWAIVGAATLTGFVVDAAIDIVPLPIFSPGVCGLTMAGAALTLKRGWEARQEADRKAALLSLYAAEAQRLHARLLDDPLHAAEAESLDFELTVARTSRDVSALRSLIDRMRGR